MKILKRTSIIFFIAGIVTFFSNSVGLSPGMPMGGVNIESNIGGLDNNIILGLIFIIIGVIFLFYENKQK